MMPRLLLISLLAIRCLVSSQPSSRPHIITIVVDDLGRAAGHYLSSIISSVSNVRLERCPMEQSGFLRCKSGKTCEVRSDPVPSLCPHQVFPQ